MTPDPGLPSPPQLPPGAAPSLGARLATALVRTWPGRLLLAGAAAKLLAALVRLATGGTVLVLEALDSLGSVALIVAAVYLVYRLVLRAKRRLLWRVRRKLILSYIFIGVIPALLIVSFFVVSGLVLFLNVASYLVRNGVTGVTNEAAYLARMTALEIQRGPGPQAAGGILAQREVALASRYQGASIALVPTTDDPCVGSRSAKGRVGSLPTLAAANRDVLPGRAGAAPEPSGTVAALYAGPWEHTTRPDVLPAWVNCSGFGGAVATGAAGARGSTEIELALRGVGLPDMARPSFAVIVDIPKNERFVQRIREETSVKIQGISPVGADLRAPAPAATPAAAPSRAPSSGAASGASASAAAKPGAAAAQDPLPIGKHRVSWVAWLEYTDWATGEPRNAAAQIEVNIADIYDRVSATQARVGTGPGALSFGNALLLVLLVLAVLFLFIEAAALVMGLALARSITGSIHELFGGTERVRVGDFSHRIAVRARDQLGELAESFNEMTLSIEDLLRQAEEKKRLEEELRIAREIQMSLLPRGRLSVPGLDVSALCVPAREVGGDYFDFLPIDDDRLALLIADVSGKGTSAAFYMAELKGVILSLSRTCPSPRQLLITANRVIADHLDSRSFITMTYGVLDLAARTLVYARAGHTPLIYRPNGGNGRPVDVLTPDGLVLGLRLDDGQTFDRLLVEETLHLERGDVLVLFKDGISEAMNPEEDMFGEARLAELVAEHGHLPTEELRERILREIEAFRAGAPQHDDMTMILLKVEDFVPGAVKTGFADGCR
jgi:serine phosphatase RsbU (regulator of sigma subunit)